MIYKKSILDHYGSAGLMSAILRAVEAQGKQLADITRDDLRALDEFHIRGRKATQELAELAGFHSGMRVLDIGCGIGGPARTLAAEFGCLVTGIDIVEEYIEAATLLSHSLGLQNEVAFRCADVSSLDYDDHTYDAVWCQHVLTNIADKRRLLGRVHRILRPGGVFALFEVCAGTHDSPYFPVPWAGDASIHFPMKSEGLRALLGENFREKEWQDVSAGSLAWYRKAVTGGPQLPLGLHLLMGPATLQKMANVVRNLEEDRIRVVQGVMIAT